MLVRGMLVRGMSVRGMSVRGMLVRGMLVRGNAVWLLRDCDSFVSCLLAFVVIGLDGLGNDLLCVAV